MRQTLFFIPHEWFGGQLLIGWLVISAIILLWMLIRHGWTEPTWSWLPVIVVGALVAHFVLPQLEVYGVNPEDPAGPFVKQGLAIRGYGVCLLLAILAGAGITLLRCRAANIEQDKILSLVLWMTIAGIAGARCLYVVQKSDEFFGTGASLWQTLVAVVDMTKGGLVVYGSLIGGMLAALIFFRQTKLSALKTADLIAPGMVLGLAIGRIGCLMNGCCYGGVCDVERLPSLQFPAGSPAYMQQLEYGDLMGLKTTANKTKGSREQKITDPAEPVFKRVVREVMANSVASQLGFEVGDRLSIYAPDSMHTEFFQQHREKWRGTAGDQLVLFIISERLGELTVPLSELSTRSLKVHPTQIYSSINAFLLCGVLWLFWTVRRYDGEVFALMLILYSIARFLLEIVRRDEAGLFDSSFTISQWVSIGAIVVGVVLMGSVRRFGRK